MTLVSYEQFKEQAPNFYGAIKALSKNNITEYANHKFKLKNPCNEKTTPEGELVEKYINNMDEFLFKLAVKIAGDENVIFEFDLQSQTLKFYHSTKNEILNKETKIINENLKKFGIIEMGIDLNQYRNAEFAYANKPLFKNEYAVLLEEFCTNDNTTIEEINFEFTSLFTEL
ncbi:hypothetical protein H1Q59_01945 [Holosporaceae bacterium 'Namur']|nr:hypothetical protein [Holosporaceae bacterium 'Namur']